MKYSLILVGLAALAPAGLAATSPQPLQAPAQVKKEPLVDRVRTAIDRSVAYLHKHQSADGGWEQAAVQSRLEHISDYRGITGTITISPKTGDRVNSPVVIMSIGPDGQYEVNSAWARQTRLHSAVTGGISHERRNR